MDYIEIKGYKSIKELHLDLKPINILIGANGAGKSNFISFFEFLKKAYDQQIKRFVAINGGVDKFLHNGRKETEQLSCRLSFDEGKYTYDFSLENDTSSSFFLSDEKVSAKEEHCTHFACVGVGEELGIKQSTNPVANEVKEYLKGLKVYHFHETGPKSPFNTDARINDNRILSSHGENLAAVLYRLQRYDPIIYQRIVKTIQSIAPYFLDFDLEPNAEGSEYIRLAWRSKYNEILYGATDLSDGTLRFIALATLFLPSNLPSVIIIDEPELGLHPFAVSKLGGMIRSAAGKGTQVIAATQSADLVDCFEPEDIITIDNMNGASRFERLDSKELDIWLEDYTVGSLWRQNMLMNRGFIQPERVNL
ncbi:cobalt transporter ATP-binding subunit [Bacteroidales bacterium Barb6]|nr:cobalt transporter ATP-binding subunit [Bacteroidales bacterium Barb6]